MPAILAPMFLARKYAINICHRVPSTMSSGEEAIGRGNSAQYVFRMRRSGCLNFGLMKAGIESYHLKYHGFVKGNLLSFKGLVS